VGHLEAWIAPPAAGPYVSPIFWLDAPQFALGETAKHLGLTGGRSGPGHAIVRLVRYHPAESLWVEQIGAFLGGVTGIAAGHNPTLGDLRSPKRYRHRRIFTVFVAGLDEAQFQAVSGFLRNLGKDYEYYAFGYPNCADLAAEAWRKAFGQKLRRGAYWFPLDLAARVINLPRKLSHHLAPLGKLSHLPWRNRTPDQVARQLARLNVISFRHRAIGDLSVDEAQNALAPH